MTDKSEIVIAILEEISSFAFGSFSLSRSISSMRVCNPASTSFLSSHRVEKIQSKRSRLLSSGKSGLVITRIIVVLGACGCLTKNGRKGGEPGTSSLRRVIGALENC